jgi:tetratricopeptide (TPR) repeat protein
MLAFKLSSTQVLELGKIGIKYGPQLYRLIEGGHNELQSLSVKTDYVFVRELLGAFDALKDFYITSNHESRQNRLRFAEECLSRNANLPPGEALAGHPSSYWEARARHGLAMIYEARGDLDLAARYVLQIFVADPRLGRSLLAPDVYVEIIKPQCMDIFARYDTELDKIYSADYKLLVFGSRALTALKGVGLLGVVGVNALAILSGRRGNPGMLSRTSDIIEQIQDEWDGVSESDFCSAAHARLNLSLEQWLDDRCREVAIQVASAIGHGPLGQGEPISSGG